MPPSDGSSESSADESSRDDSSSSNSVSDSDSDSDSRSGSGSGNESSSSESDDDVRGKKMESEGAGSSSKTTSPATVGRSGLGSSSPSTQRNAELSGTASMRSARSPVAVRYGLQRADTKKALTSIRDMFAAEKESKEIHGDGDADVRYLLKQERKEQRDAARVRRAGDDPKELARLEAERQKMAEKEQRSALKRADAAAKEEADFLSRPRPADPRSKANARPSEPTLSLDDDLADALGRGDSFEQLASVEVKQFTPPGPRRCLSFSDIPSLDSEMLHLCAVAEHKTVEAHMTSGDKALRGRINHPEEEIRAQADKDFRDLVKDMMFDRHARVSICDVSGTTPLHHVAVLGAPLTAAWIVDQGCHREIAFSIADEKSRPAAESGLRKLVLEARSDVDDGGTPLHWAARAGESATVAALVEAGAPVDAMDYRGRTPLDHAIRRVDVASVNVLLKAGAFVTETHILVATTQRHVQPSRHVPSDTQRAGMRVVEALMRSKSTVRFSESDEKSGDNALLYAARRHPTLYFSMWRIFRDNIAVPIPNNARTGRSLLTALAQSEDFAEEDLAEQLEQLLQQADKSGANVNEIHPRSGQPLLHRVILKGKAFCATTAGILIDNGADPCLPDKSGNTALHAVALSMSLDAKQKIQLAEKLIMLGADVATTNEDGQTALDLVPSGEDVWRKFRSILGSDADAAAEQVTKPSSPAAGAGSTTKTTRVQHIDLTKADDDDVLMSGILTKEGGHVRNWNQRFFTLTPRELKYFDGPPESGGQEKGTIPLSAISEKVKLATNKKMATKDGASKAMNCLKIVTTNQRAGGIAGTRFKGKLGKIGAERTYYACAVDGAEAQLWIDTINLVIDQLAKTSMARKNEFARRSGAVKFTDFSGTWELSHRISESLIEILKMLGRNLASRKIMNSSGAIMKISNTLLEMEIDMRSNKIMTRKEAYALDGSDAVLVNHALAGCKCTQRSEWDGKFETVTTTSTFTQKEAGQCILTEKRFLEPGSRPDEVLVWTIELQTENFGRSGPVRRCFHHRLGITASVPNINEAETPLSVDTEQDHKISHDLNSDGLDSEHVLESSDSDEQGVTQGPSTNASGKMEAGRDEVTHMEEARHAPNNKDQTAERGISNDVDSASDTTPGPAVKKKGLGGRLKAGAASAAKASKAGASKGTKFGGKLLSRGKK